MFDTDINATIQEEKLEVKSRDIGSMVSGVSNRKKKSAGASSGQAVSSDSQTVQVHGTDAASPMKTLKHILGVALVSVITGIILGKRY